MVEGEKAADAAELRFPGYVVTTSLGGAKAAATADWSPLRDRVVTIWPDADEAGLHYAKDVVAQLEAVGAATIRLVAVPTSYPAGMGFGGSGPGRSQMTNFAGTFGTAPCGLLAASHPDRNRPGAG